MIWMNLRRAATGAITLLVPVLAAACGALDVSDPTAIEDKDLASATGADLLRREVLGQWYDVVGDAAVQSGMLADEFLSDPSPGDLADGYLIADLALDQREGQKLEEAGAWVYQRWQGTRRSAGTAMEQLRKYAPAIPGQAHIGQMFLVRGYATLALVEDYCGGFPLNEVVDGRVIIRPPLTTAALFERALADFDSAVVYAADSARIADAARVARARTLLGLGRAGEAGVAAGAVATEYVWTAEFNSSETYQPNPLAFGRFGRLSQSIADGDGGNGLDFVSANDPRVQVTPLGTANDGTTGIYAIAKYPDDAAPMVLLSGVEARLIQAEAALDGGGDWLGILNDLRATQVTPALPALADPGTDAARVDLLFRERAFWLFATGHRLADLRRLVRTYGRDPETVFPSGAYRLGDIYGAAASIAFPVAKEAAHNPAVTGCAGD